MPWFNAVEQVGAACDAEITSPLDAELQVDPWGTLENWDTGTVDELVAAIAGVQDTGGNVASEAVFVDAVGNPGSWRNRGGTVFDVRPSSTNLCTVPGSCPGHGDEVILAVRYETTGSHLNDVRLFGTLDAGGNPVPLTGSEPWIDAASGGARTPPAISSSTSSN